MELRQKIILTLFANTCSASCRFPTLGSCPARLTCVDLSISLVSSVLDFWEDANGTKTDIEINSSMNTASSYR